MSGNMEEIPNPTEQPNSIENDFLLPAFLDFVELMEFSVGRP